jgi:hypothetical protein
METKICSKCSIEKSLSEYHKRSNRPCGVRSQCKQCYKDYPKELKRREGYTRQYDLMKTYGITTDQYNELLANQSGVCAICKSSKPSSESSRKKFFCVDHCHNTGEIRGLLCDSCNRGIGLLKDSVEILKQATEYLEKHSNTIDFKNNNNKYVKFFEYI